MRKIILIGRSGAGKTTLTQALKGEEIHYHKTQYVNYSSCIIDTPGEYAQSHELGYALALYSYEADVVGLQPVPAQHHLYGEPGGDWDHYPYGFPESAGGSGRTMAAPVGVQKAFLCEFPCWRRCG